MTPSWFPLTRDQAAFRPARELPPLITWILVAIAAVEVVSWAILPSWQDALILNFGAHLFDPVGRLHPEWAYTFLTYWLIHGGIWHALFNGVWIFAFGPVVLRHMGPRRFAVFFLAAAVAGAVAHTISVWGQFTVAIGASGCVFGLIGAGAYLLTEGPTVPRKLRNMALYIAVFVVLNIAFATLGSVGSGGVVSWEAHLGGMIAGLVLFPLLARDTRTPPPGPFGSGGRRRPDYLRPLD